MTRILLLLAVMDIVIISGCATAYRANALPVRTVKASDTKPSQATVQSAVSSSKASEGSVQNSAAEPIKVINGDTKLFDASVQNDVAGVKKIMKSGTNVDSANEDGSTPLMAASKRGHTRLVKLLLEKGANVNSASASGFTPLILAASNGHTEIAKLLIAKGADLSARDNSGKTALEWAKTRNHTKTYNAIVAAKQPAVTTTPNITTVADLKTLIAKKDMVGLRAYLDEHPEELLSIKNANLRLRYTGPAKLRIIDIEKLVKDGNNDAQIIEQIDGAKGPYKRFTGSDKAALNKMTISDKLVTAMISVTTKYDAEQKLLSEQQSNQAKQTPVKSVQKEPVQPLQQAIAESVQPQEPEVNPAAECLKLAAASKACDYAPGGFFAATICKTVARSTFSCPGM